ncbi:MAG: hypothetical protein QN178_09090 [Armatimonadota bacterium]|nr:hypothetical protein [Armatimonadota bacterium]
MASSLHVTPEQVQAVIADSRPERLADSAKRPVVHHAAHIVQLTGWGHCGLAADHLLFPEITGSLPAVVADVIRELNLRFAAAGLRVTDTRAAVEARIRTRQFAYSTLLEMALNFAGLESRWLDAEEKRQATESIGAALAEWEAREAAKGPVSVAAAVVRHMLSRMKLVQKGAGMVAGIAARIEGSLDFNRPVLLAFLDHARAEIERNVYARMVREGHCRFGNDYALGLRWLRHLGFEQVSTNPVLAALAYQDDPTLSQSFQMEVRAHHKFAEWARAPEKSADDIALYATLLALWDNLHVYRPIFFNLADESGGGVVSFQLNPNIAHLTDASLRDVFTVIEEATEDLRVYDDHLLAGYGATRERARPNLVIKVAASSPAARDIARTINGFGIGSNVTVVFTAAQEVTLMLEELAGMASAVKKGIVPTQVYMTNMGGRLESHLREVKLEELFDRLKERKGERQASERLRRLASANGTEAAVDRAGGYAAKVVAATRYAAQRTIDERVIQALADVASAEELRAWEDVIGKSGTLVARRVWGIFFSPANREKWLHYLCRAHRLNRDQAECILNRLHYLPASKRKPHDTYWTLARRNMVHTEFPNHQENVRRLAESPGFELAAHLESVTAGFAPDVVERLRSIPDFRRAYELTPELNEILREAGIEGDFGSGGLRPDQWPDFGSVQKTVAEFKGAYAAFRDEMLRVFKASAKPRRVTRTRAHAATRSARHARRPRTRR